MSSTIALRVSPFLRWLLLADAASCIAMGILLLAAAGPLAALLGLPAALLEGAGIALLPFGAFVLWLATRERISRPLVWTVIVINALWVLDSVLLLLTDWVEPNLFGYAFVLIQAAAVAVLAELQYIGLRRTAPAAPAY